MQAVKGNRSYKITDEQKVFYIKQGFDIKDDSGRVIEYGAGKTVPYGQYKAALDEIEELKSKLGATPSNGIEVMSKAELKELADQLKIEYSSRTTNEQFIELIKKAQEAAEKE